MLDDLLERRLSKLEARVEALEGGCSGLAGSRVRVDRSGDAHSGSQGTVVAVTGKPSVLVMFGDGTLGEYTVGQVTVRP